LILRRLQTNKEARDFHAVACVQFAFATAEIDLKTGKELERARVNAIKISPLIDQSILERP
jgi:hypothetical protein